MQLAYSDLIDSIGVGTLLQVDDDDYQRMPDIRPGNAAYNGRFQVPTQEIIDLARAEGRRQLGLNRCGADVPVHLQSFAPSSRQRLDRMSDLPVVQLVDAVGKPYDFVVSGDPRTYADLVTRDGMRWVHRYADVVAVNKDLIVPRDATGHLDRPTTLVRDAHRTGLDVHAWRFANENTYLPADFRVGADPIRWGDHAAEYRLFYRLGIDGVLTDFPDAAVAAHRRR
jgi:glycerophosphoryl diester phosphodiesterase